MLVSLAIVIVLPQPHGIRALIASTILRLIFSVGLEPTLLLLGGFNVSVKNSCACAASHLDYVFMTQWMVYWNLPWQTAQSHAKH